jgi:hypothetical protein
VRPVNAHIQIKSKPKQMNQSSHIIAFGVYYVPNREGKIFAGLKSELQGAFNNQSDAIDFCQSLQIGGNYDELHVGYRVYPMQYIPKNVIVR